MEILVCLKQVPDDSVEIHLKPGTEEVNLDGVTPVVNAFDTYALEMATRLKEAVGGNITAITVGPEKARDAVKTCLAVGANQGYVISDPTFEGADTLPDPAWAGGRDRQRRQRRTRQFPFQIEQEHRAAVQRDGGARRRV